MAYFLAFYLTLFLAFYLAYLLTFHLAYFLAFILHIVSSATHSAAARFDREVPVEVRAVAPAMKSWQGEAGEEEKSEGEERRRGYELL